MTQAAEPHLPATAPPAQVGVKWRWWKWTSAALLVLTLGYFVIVAWNWPFKQQTMMNALERRTLSTVTIGRFARTYFPPGCTAEDIRFLHREHKEKQPVITVGKLVLVTSYSRIFTLQHRLSLARVVNMHVFVPPDDPGQSDAVMPLTHSKSGPGIKIDRIIADQAILDFLSGDSSRSYRLTVDKLRLDGVGDNVPLSYQVLLSNQMPPGKIRSAGVFGPWNPKDPGSTPLQGNFTFDNANLAAVNGISGTMSSAGNFRGKLREIDVHGTADVPQFKVKTSRHPVQLAVAYHATVDGTNGDTILNEVTAHFDHTVGHFKGTVAKGNSPKGKIASIDLWTGDGRIEDILRLFTSAETAAMTGTFSFRGHTDLPPGPEPFLRKLKLTGDFGVAAGTFANPKTETGLTRLSDSAIEKDHGKSAAEQSPDRALSDLKGHASAVNGTATLSDVSFGIPGAKARLHGRYGLISHEIDLHGTLLTTGNPSSTTTGFKSLMVKVITPFFQKKQAAKVIPFKITGLSSHMKPSLDVGRRK